MRKIETDIIPLVISIILVFTSMVIILSSEYIFNYKQYIGIGGLILSAFLYFKNRVYYYIFFGLVLLVGIFGFLDFYYTTYKVGFGNFGINPIFLGLLILLFVFIYHIADKKESN